MPYRIVAPMLSSLPMIRNQLVRSLLVGLVVVLAYPGLLVAPGVLLLPLGSVLDQPARGPGRVGMLVLSLVLLGACGVKLGRSIAVEACVHRVVNIDRILLLCGIVLWSIAAPVIAISNWP
jgi:hypothetical protein